jgi:hypothetical protein
MTDHPTTPMVLSLGGAQLGEEADLEGATFDNSIDIGTASSGDSLPQLCSA